MPTIIAVTGRAEERVEPELGAVSLAVGTSGAERDAIMRSVAETHERLLEEVRELDASGAL
ncbi:MAG TPA: SIMPL domain-containing protein, partial [Agromyces sp.]|nr:SIMPL domain-containing protein [Agromyces sp.]